MSNEKRCLLNGISIVWYFFICYIYFMNILISTIFTKTVKLNSCIRGRLCVEKSKSVNDAHTFEGRTFDWFTMCQQKPHISNGFMFRMKTQMYK